MFFLLQAKVEPPWADNCAMRIEKWGILVNALNKLAIRSAALEGLLEVTSPSHVKLLFSRKACAHRCQR